MNRKDLWDKLVILASISSVIVSVVSLFKSNDAININTTNQITFNNLNQDLKNLKDANNNLQEKLTYLEKKHHDQGVVVKSDPTKPQFDPEFEASIKNKDQTNSE